MIILEEVAEFLFAQTKFNKELEEFTKQTDKRLDKLEDETHK